MKKTLIDFENFLKSHDTSIFESFHPYFQDAFWEMVVNGGKRFRPSLLFSIVLANDKKKIKDSFCIALALEVLHTYSLIHDDLPAMDNSPLRRGHTTLHIKYDECGAILAGDALNTYAFYLISNSNFSDKIKVEIIKSLGFGALKMVLGQACDCFFENKKLDKSKIDFIHLNKTAALIASSLEIGGIIALLDKNEIKKLKIFGTKLGLYFQIKDDVLDSTSVEEVLGKPINNDISKNSYVNLLGLQKAKDAKDRLKDELLLELDTMQDNIQKNLKELLKSH
ncbi:polyprenyl synthetase family protein [Helicobacter sp. MIT 99-5507]|uniref:polyprenyl synthetase family protein n=1 Tax=Helicobacter sp. MIT 99-5507 TaxID=152489 RepID=UPI000E1E5199|nr:polyprenyl synthetase family protein [Helicobacter sp. MIT 99-5507]RDU57350.1 geranyl transferase [Helicobacter sp. MIT 99-5507]